MDTAVGEGTVAAVQENRVLLGMWNLPRLGSNWCLKGRILSHWTKQ